MCSIGRMPGWQFSRLMRTMSHLSESRLKRSNDFRCDCSAIVSCQTIGIWLSILMKTGNYHVLQVGSLWHTHPTLALTSAEHRLWSCLSRPFQIIPDSEWWALLYCLSLCWTQCLNGESGSEGRRMAVGKSLPLETGGKKSEITFISLAPAS